MPSKVDRILHPQPELQPVPDEPHYLIALEGAFPSEPIEPTDPENLPKALVGSYMMG